MFEDEFRQRLTDLRIEKNVSAREMSLSIGQSESYINRIENQKMLPSMNVFFYICEYLKITPADFFQSDKRISLEMIDAIQKLQAMDEEKRKHILEIIDDMQ